MTFTGRSHHGDNSQAPLRQGQRTGAARRAPSPHRDVPEPHRGEGLGAKIEGDIDQGKHYGYSRVRTLADAIDAFTEAKATIKTADDRDRHLAWWREALRQSQAVPLHGATLSTKAASCWPTENIEPNAKKPARHRAPQTVRHYLMSLSACMEYARRKKRWIDKNPVADVDAPPVSPGRIRWLYAGRAQGAARGVRQVRQSRPRARRADRARERRAPGGDHAPALAHARPGARVRIPADRRRPASRG